MRLSLTAILLTACAGASLAKPAPPVATNQVSKLVVVLQSGASQKEKADACRELARIGTSEAVAPLAALLTDYDLSHMARYGLETIPDPAVDKALRDALPKVHGRLLVGVIGSIGVRGDPRAVKLLAPHLQSMNPEVAQGAARALGKIGNQAAAIAIWAALPPEPHKNPALPPLPSSRSQKPLPATGEANKVAFCEGLICCAESLAARGDRRSAIHIYDRVRAMNVPHQVRTAALRGAVLTRQPDGLPLLLDAMRGSDFALFATCARISQEMPGTNVTLALAGELRALSTNRQVFLIQTLAYRQDATALPALTAIAKDGQPPARLAAIRALPEIGAPSVLPVLLELARDSDQDIAAAAQQSLGALQGQQIDAAVMAMLNDSEASQRLAAMDLIVRRRMTSALPALLAAAESPDQKVRVAAVKKVGELGGAAELPAVLDLLAKAKSPEDLEATEQALSTLALKSTDSAACVKELESRMAAAQPPQKCALVRVLAALGGNNALKAVRAAVSDPNKEVHAAAIRALGGWSTADAAPDLIELAKGTDNATDKMICLRGYLRLAGQADLPVDKRLAMCRQAATLTQKDDEKKLLLAALGGIASIEALDLITPCLDEPGTKVEAATAAVDVAEKLLKEKDAEKYAVRLLNVLTKVSDADAGTELTKRAKSLCDQAKAKAPKPEATTK
jgi:HEAT repeat protein